MLKFLVRADFDEAVDGILFIDIWCFLVQLYDSIALLVTQIAGIFWVWDKIVLRPFEFEPDESFSGFCLHPRLSAEGINSKELENS